MTKLPVMKEIKSDTPRIEGSFAKLPAILLAVATLAIAGVATAQDAGSGAAPRPRGQAAPQGQPSPQKMQKLRNIRSQIEQITQKLSSAQQEALKKEKVQEKQIEFRKAMSVAIVKQNPEMESVLEEHDTLAEKLENSPDLKKPQGQRSQKFQQRLQKYRQLQQKVSAERQKAAQKEKVQKKRKAFENLLISEMSKVEPETPQLMEKRQGLMQQFRALRQ